MTVAPDPTTINRLYGRSSGHKLRAAQAALVDNLLPQIAVPAEGEITPGACSATTAPFTSKSASARASISPTAPTCCPIMASSAASRSSTASPPRSGAFRDQQLANVRIHMGDALDVLRRLPDESASFVYLLHPDPWPKARHAKRRMVNDGPLDLIAAKLKPGGEFRIATDHPVYLNWMLMVMARHADDFEWLVKDRPTGRVTRAAGPRPATPPRRGAKAVCRTSSAIAASPLPAECIGLKLGAMIAAIARPIPMIRLAILTLALGLAVAIYCVAYASLSGRTETLAQSLAWAMINVCPWLVAIEAGKRAADGTAVLVALGPPLHCHWDSAWRLATVVARVRDMAPCAGVDLDRRHRRRVALAGEARGSVARANWLPCPCSRARSTGSARPAIMSSCAPAAGRSSTARRSARPSASSRDHGFIRIHRSTLVRRDRIARVRPHDVVLRDGTHLKIGKRFRAALAA